jgi:hypothetical protein
VFAGCVHKLAANVLLRTGLHDLRLRVVGAKLHRKRVVVCLQEQKGFKAADVKVYNLGNLVRVAQEQMVTSQQRYDDLYDSVKTTVSRKFMSYMHRRDHSVGGRQL